MRPRSALLALAALALAVAASPAAASDASGTEESPGPAQALIASAAYPGLGQLLNGEEAKAAVIGGAEAFLVASLVLEDRQTRHALRLYEETGESRYYDRYSRHFDRRQTLIWWVVVAALYGVADAYVDAHLTGFNEPGPPFLEGDYQSGADDGLSIGIAVGF
jgi:hypothetical protein